MTNASFKDFAENFPDAYRLRIASYWEDYANYENGFKPVPMHWRKSRNTVKKSMKKSSAIKNRHKVEHFVDFSLPKIRSKDTLILPIIWESEILAYCKTDIGEFVLEWSHKRLAWCASWHGKTAHDQNPFRALAKLLGQDWGIHKTSGIRISLYDLYSDIVFDWGQKPKVRNRTRRIIDTPKSIQMIYDYTPKKRPVESYAPPKKNDAPEIRQLETPERYEPKMTFEKPQYHQYFDLSRI